MLHIVYVSSSSNIYITIINLNLLIIMIRVVRGVVRCDFGPFLAKTIIAPHLIFAVTCAVRCIKNHLQYKNSTYISPYNSTCISNITILNS